MPQGSPSRRVVNAMPSDEENSREMKAFEVEAALEEIEYSLQHIKDELKFARRYLKKLAQ